MTTTSRVVIAAATALTLVSAIGFERVRGQEAPVTAPTSAAAATGDSQAYLKQLELENKTRELNNMRIAMVAVCVFALLSWFVLYRKMTPGFGPMNLRAFGIVLVTTFATFLALLNSSALTAAIGLLGAVAGYLFGTKDAPPDRG